MGRSTHLTQLRLNCVWPVSGIKVFAAIMNLLSTYYVSDIVLYGFWQI